jgi:hypothetical protein
VPSEPLTDLKIAQRACTRAGFPPISSLSDGTAEAQVLIDNIDSIIDDALATYQWPFALNEKTLARLADAPPVDFTGMYALPADCLHLRRVVVNGCPVSWGLYSGRVAVDADLTDEVRAEYTSRVDASRFHPVFVEYVVYRLASVLATGVAHDAARGELFETMAQRYFRRARWASAKERTPRRLTANRLTGYR